ncbi:MAG TPA: protein kinase [Gemmatimonadaceae bacterium]|nr:protein kinase [Gemmatimonadaceae bacterium]
MTDPLREELQRSLGTAYTIERELGGGAMARVFVARDERLAREIVVKVVSPTLAVELSAERFQREIALAARLQEPHIVPVLSAGETADGLPYYTMPFVAGESLRGRLARGRLDTSEALSIVRDVACALAYAHEHAVVHRDIKPENVLLSSGTAVVADFGIAKAISVSRTSEEPEKGTATLTRAGTAIGTPAYMSPEQAAGGAIDGKADVYAWGVLAYELLAGIHPFATWTTAPQLISAHLTERPRPLSSLASRVPAAVAALVMRALAKAPADRPTAAELLAGLNPTSRSATVGVRRPVLWVGAASLLLLAGAGALALRDRARATPATDPSAPDVGAPITSVAVMPFANTGGDRSDDYFSDGLSDELAHALVKVPGMRIAGRASSNAFRGKSATASEIGRVLGVAAIIEGTVRRAGGRLRVTAQLTSTTDGHVIWTSEPFESRSADVFQVQDEFTRAVVTALAPTLRAPGTAMATQIRGTRDARAYDLYLHGRYFWSRRGAGNLNRAIGYFRQAVAADPDFARAHAGLALSYVVLPFFDASVSTDSLMNLAQASADRALALDPAIADAHLALANVNARHFRIAEMRPHFRAALANAPLDPTAHSWYADYLERLGKRDSALIEKRRAVELEPLSALFTSSLAQTLYLSNRFPEALAVAHRVAELDSTFTRGYYTLARIHLFGGFPDSALAALETARRFGPPLPGTRGLQVLAYAAAARWPEARHLRDSLHVQSDARRSHGDVALAALAFGDRAAALDALERTANSLTLPTISGSPGCDPMFEPLHAEQRFVALMQRIGTNVCTIGARWPVSAPPH